MARNENISVEDADVEQEMQRIADSYKVPIESVRARCGDKERKDMMNSLMHRKIVDFLLAAADVKEVAAK